MTKATKRVIIVAVAFVVMAAIVLGMVAALTNGSTGGYNTTENGGMIMGESEGNGVALTSSVITPEDYTAYGVSALAESAYTVTATIEPATAANKNVDWSLSWADSESSWAIGKTVTDYVSISSSGLTCTVSCLQAFGERVILTVTSDENSAISATCTIDYRERVESVGLTLNMNGGNYAIQNTPEIPVPESGTSELLVEKSLGSISCEITSSVIIKFSEEFCTAFSQQFTSMGEIRTEIALPVGTFSYDDLLYDLLFSESSYPSALLQQLYSQIVTWINDTYSGTVLSFVISLTIDEEITTYVYDCPLSDIVVPVGGVSLDETGIIF